MQTLTPNRPVSDQIADTIVRLESIARREADLYSDDPRHSGSRYEDTRDAETYRMSLYWLTRMLSQCPIQ